MKESFALLLVIRMLFLAGCFMAAVYFVLSLFRSKRRLDSRIRSLLRDDER